MGLPSCVKGMRDIYHDCQQPYRLKAAKTVYLHGIQWSRMGDINTGHIYGPKCKNSHAQPIAVGSKTVFVESRGAGRKTDAVLACTAVQDGFPDILTGG